ncbi:MAG: YihY/virulence factor BrkB family protein [Clostridia bacterium]|nr:YihY/virulence factor BrkB family protein [Clostridia bacterium]
MSEPAKSNKLSFISRTLKAVTVRFYTHSIGQNAAALAYYFLFALFPMLIFISNLLGILDLNIYAITNVLQRFLPSAVVGTIESYLDYVSHTSSKMLMWFSLIFCIWFPMRAIMGLMADVRRAYGLGRPEHPFRYIFKQLVFTVLFLAVIVVTFLLSLAGEQVLSYIIKLISETTFASVDHILSAWQYLRFIPLALLMFVGIGALYSVSLDKRPKVKSVLPGIFFSLITWLTLSIGFSFYVENFSDYSLIYGTLGTFIVLLLWLYLTAITLISGAELNAAIDSFRANKQHVVQE